MTGSISTIEVPNGPERRQRWMTALKLAMVEETCEPDVAVSLITRRNGLQPNQLFHWRKLASRGALTATAAQDDGRVAVERSNLRWCSDGFEIGCDNGEKVRVAFALDCCGRAAIAHVATTQGIKGEDVRDLIVIAVESHFGRVNRLSRKIEWFSDNGLGYIAHETRAMTRDIGLEPRVTPVQSLQSNNMAEAFVRTMRRDYIHVSALPNARTAMESLPLWFDHYNSLHPHKALGYRSPRG